MSVSFVLEALVVVGAIVMGTRAGGVGVGLWGGLGTFVLVFIFGEAPGEPPAAAVAIILAVVRRRPSCRPLAGSTGWSRWPPESSRSVRNRSPSSRR